MPLQLYLALYAIKVRAAKTLLEGFYGISSVRFSTATSAPGHRGGDREAIAAEGYDVTVPILVCNSVEFSSIKGSVGVHVEEMDQLIVARER